MYHIKNDKRSAASARELVQGLIECSKGKPMNAITVSDIHRATGVSRATFYRLFDTPADVLSYQFDQMAADAVTYFQTDDNVSYDNLLEKTILLGMQNSEILYAVVENNRLDLLYQYTCKVIRSLYAQKRILPQEMDCIQQDYMISHLSVALAATLIIWIQNGRKETASQLAQYIQECAKVVLKLIAGS